MPIFGAQQRLGVAALLLAVSSLISRLMGLIRDKIISWQFGTGSETDLYFAAFVVPDIINYLLAGAFVSITLIPQLAQSFREDAARAWDFFSAIVNWIFIASTILTILGMCYAEPLASILAPGFSPKDQLRLAFFMRLVLPAQVFFLTGSCFTSLLFLRHQFRVPAITPLIYNGCIILAGVLLPAISCLFSEKTSYALEVQHFGMTGYCLGVSLGAFLGAFLLPYLTARAQGLELRLCFTNPRLKKFLLFALPLMLGQTIIMLDEQFLRIFGSYLGSGWVALLNFARRLTQVPISLVGQAAAVASYPFLVQLLTQEKEDEFFGTLRKAIRTALCLIIPCVGFMWATSDAILTLLLQGGRFTSAATANCTVLMQIMLLGVPLWIVYMILVRAFYARCDTLTPVLTGTCITVIALPCYYFLSQHAHANVLAITSVVSVSSYILWLMLIWRRRFGVATFAGFSSTTCRLLLATLPPTIIIYLGILYLRPSQSLYPQVTAFVCLFCAGLLFLAIFLPLLRIFLPQDAQAIIDKLKNRLKSAATAPKAQNTPPDSQ